LASDPYPLNDKFFLVSCNPTQRYNDPSAYGLYLLDVFGNLVKVYDEALDLVHFVKVTNCRGGVAPEEVARMIEVRRKRLAEAWARHLARIEKLEQGRAKLLADLKNLCQEPNAKQP
jgi:hypothetical protein